MKISLFRKAKAGGLAKVPEPPRPTPVLASLQSVLLLPICRLFISSFSASRCILHHLFYLILGLLSSQLLFFTHSSILAVIVFSIYCSHLVFSDFQLQCLPVSWFFQLEFHLAFVCQVLHSRTQYRHLLQHIIVLMLFRSTPLRYRPCQLSPIRLLIGSSVAQPGVLPSKTVFAQSSTTWASRRASVCTRRNCRSLHDMARYFLSSRPPSST